MRVEVRGRHMEVTPELEDQVRKRVARVGRQVGPTATLEVVLHEERNPAIADNQIAEATLRAKGVTLTAKEASPDMVHSIKCMADDIRRQVKRHNEKHRNRSGARRFMAKLRRAESSQETI